MRNPLDKALRNQLEKVVEKARDIAELAAKEEVQRLAVGEKSAPDYLSEKNRDLRNRLRAHARFSGDLRKASGEQEVERLVTEIAYEHWHRMLFSRFLAENSLLMYEDGVTPLAIRDCFDLAEEETGDSSNGWRYAAGYAAKMLPQIFRNDSPVFEIELPPNQQKKLEQELEGLDPDIFHSQDALGWVYQFWQSKRKAEVNASEVKIGAKELSPVTQLFTEPYMVSFLLDNALGAWWAKKSLRIEDFDSAESEEELREKAAIEGIPLNYLRFVKTHTVEQQLLFESDDTAIEKQDPRGSWKLAAGGFEQWPDQLSELKILDPCCGSGHFLVAVFLMLVPLRMHLDGLNEDEAIDAVLSENIYGLELDQRCIEIAVFALALEAWRYPKSSGYRQLPLVNLACSGLSVKAAKEEWRQLGLGRKNLMIALDLMHKTFEDAPTLGSLINPRRSKSAKIVQWKELEVVLNRALGAEEKYEKKEANIVAQGLAKNVAMLADSYQWIVTNPPYLTIKKQSAVLKEFSENQYPVGKHDLATVFIERINELLTPGGFMSVVLPQNWTFQSSYKKLREKLLIENSINIVARFGSGAFESISGEVVKAMLFSMKKKQEDSEDYVAIDCEILDGIEGKKKLLKQGRLVNIKFSDVNSCEDYRITFTESIRNARLLSSSSISMRGIVSGDNDKWVKRHFELIMNSQWRFYQGTPDRLGHHRGKVNVVDWSSEGRGMLRPGTKNEAYGRKGVALGQIGKLPASLYQGNYYDNSTGVIIPNDNESLESIWCYLSDQSYHDCIRDIDQSLKVTNATLLKVPFESEYWVRVAEERYPRGLPRPYTNDPNQWIFHGHPCGSVAWNEQVKWTEKSSLRIDETVLQVSVARLLGYRWPAEVDPDMELAVEQRELVEASKELRSFVDDDGIVCLRAVRGEKAAHQRLEELLQCAYGSEWSSQTRNQLLEIVGCKNKSLDVWLEEKFFEQHCKLFQHRPFIWHIWDGLKDGFSALVNYHQLDKKNLERLIYTYLDDWIRTQSHQRAEGVDGAAERLVAANNLKEKLESVLEGEAPYDIFVRWKPIEEQAVGWSPDLNDGVRLNIRPFISVADVGKKGAGVLRAKPNIHWKKDRGRDVESAPWFTLGLEYGGKEGDRINDHHLSLYEKQKVQNT